MKIRYILLAMSAFAIVLGSGCSSSDSSSSSDEKQTSHRAKDLSQLFRHYGSDKDVNGYTALYHTLFDHKKNQKIRMLEIGIGTMIPDAHSSMVGYALSNYKPGGSLRAWRDYFINGEIYGVDVQSDTQFSDEPRIKTYLADSTDPAEVNELFDKLGNTQFDIIVDDGSHRDENQFKTLVNFYPHLAEGGIYIVEDIYPGSEISTNPGKVAEICNGDPLFYSGLKNNLCVILKKPLNRGGQEYNY